MSIVSSVANYGGRQPNNTSYIKQFVTSATSLVEWIFVTTSGTTYIEPSVTNKDIYIPQSMIVNGDLTVNGAFSNPSDARLKCDVCDLEDEKYNKLVGDLSERLAELRPVSYYFKHDVEACKVNSNIAIGNPDYSGGGNSNIAIGNPGATIKTEPTRRYGLIAQEVQELFPELVTKPGSPDEMLAVNYIELVPLLLAEMQKMNNQIKDLEIEVQKLSDAEWNRERADSRTRGRRRY